MALGRVKTGSKVKTTTAVSINSDSTQPLPLLVESTNMPKFSHRSSESTASKKTSLLYITPAQYRMMSLAVGKVKSVQGGDSFIVTSIHNESSERVISLAFVTAPHFRKEGDEQWSFESRDFLRRLLVGKAVTFQVMYQAGTIQREYASVTLPDGQKLPEVAVKEGWVKVRDDAGRNDTSEKTQHYITELRLLEAQARSTDKGIWNKEGGRIDVKHDLGDPQNFATAWKGKVVDGLVERVLSGDRMLVRLFFSSTSHTQVMTLVAGIRAPGTERADKKSQHVQPAEEFGNEAQKFVEDRLLQRNVRVRMFGLSPQNQLIASIHHPKGSIAQFLLEEGLARCTDYHSTLLGADMAPLRQAEKVAQATKKGLFKEHVAKNVGNANLEASITKIFSADVVQVRNKAGVEKRINFSSLRGPRLNETAEAPFREAAKEFLRKRLIGKHVRVNIDGSRPATAEYDAKEVATITHNDKNIGLLLVQEGWCSVVRHKKDDPDRAPNYDELLAAQEKAKEENKGMWSKKSPAVKPYLDASESVQRAKMHLASLSRQKRIPSILDFVKSGSRFIVLIPRESLKLNFVLGGIRAPRSARNANEKSEPFGQEAHDLANRRCGQRDVEVDIHDVDKTGAFIGDIYINRESFAKILVEEGLATVHEYSAEQSGNLAELLAAQKRAKDARKNIWTDWNPSQEEPGDEKTEIAAAADANGDATPQKRVKDYRDVIVTNVDESGKLKIQIVGPGTSALETMMRAFSSFHINPANSKGLPGPPKAGDLVASKFSEDNNWYRARIRSNNRAAKEAEVVYIDYGNTEKRPWSLLRPLSQAEFSPQKLKAQAVDASLSLLQLPTQVQYLQDSVAFITELTAGKELVANVDHTDKDGTLYITLYDADSDPGVADSINGTIVTEGLAMVPRKLKTWETGFSDVLKVLREKELVAKEEERRGMWEYGDLTED